MANNQLTEIPPEIQQLTKSVDSRGYLLLEKACIDELRQLNTQYSLINPSACFATSSCDRQSLQCCRVAVVLITSSYSR